MSPNRATVADKSIRFFPLAAAQPLNTPSWPEALNASGSWRAFRMAISRNAYALIALPDFSEFAQAARHGVRRSLRGWGVRDQPTDPAVGARSGAAGPPATATPHSGRPRVRSREGVFPRARSERFPGPEHAPGASRSS